MIYEDRISRAGCSETFKYFESMPGAELYKFMGREALTKEVEEAKELKVAQMFRYLFHFGAQKCKKRVLESQEGLWTKIGKRHKGQS